MDTLDSMKIFVAVAEARSFSKAAQRLGLSAPAVSRSVAALEERLGAQLLRRTTRSVTLTEAGDRYREQVRRILADIEAVEADAGASHAVPRGELRLTAPRMFGRLYLAPLVVEFLKAHPGISVRAVFEDHIVHLLDEGFDVALRIARLADSGLAALRVGEVRRLCVASPAYLKERGTPRVPEELAAHSVVTLAAGGGVPTRWDFAGPGGTGRLAIDLPPAAFQTNSNEAAIAAAVSGGGIARVLSYQVAAQVAEKKLVVILQQHEPEPIPVQLVHGGGRRPPARVRAFLDFVAPRLRAEAVLRGPRAGTPGRSAPRG